MDYRKIGGHVVAALVAFGIGGAGLAKLAGVQELADNFARWGFPWWFVYLTGLLEVTGAVLVAIPRTRMAGAGLLVAVMLAATATHVRAGELDQIVAPLVFAVLAATAGLLQLQATRGTGGTTA